MSTVNCYKSQVIGIIGGMGPAADIRLQQLIREATPATRDQDHIRILCDSNPTIPDRTESLARDGGDAFAMVLVESARVLERAGATMLVMACHTAHARCADVVRAVPIPVLDLVQLTVDEVSRQYLNIRRVGILATDGTLRSSLYTNAFSRVGMECIEPDAESQATLMRAVYAIKRRSSETAVSKDLQSVAAHLVFRGAEVLILACTELSLCPFVFANSHVVVIDPLRVVADYIVTKSGPPCVYRYAQRASLPPLRQFLRVVMARQR